MGMCSMSSVIKAIQIIVKNYYTPSRIKFETLKKTEIPNVDKNMELELFYIPDRTAKG